MSDLQAFVLAIIGSSLFVTSLCSTVKRAIDGTSIWQPVTIVLGIMGTAILFWVHRQHNRHDSN